MDRFLLGDAEKVVHEASNSTGDELEAPKVSDLPNIKMVFFEEENAKIIWKIYMFFPQKYHEFSLKNMKFWILLAHFL